MQNGNCIRSIRLNTVPHLYDESLVSLGILCRFQLIYCVDFVENVSFESSGDICWPPLPSSFHDQLSMDKEIVMVSFQEDYSGISIIRIPLGPYQTVHTIEVSLVQMLVQSMHSITSHTSQSIRWHLPESLKLLRQHKKGSKLRGLIEREISISGTVKRHFYVGDKFMWIRQNRPLDKFIWFLFMRCSALCIVTHGTIKIYVVQICATSAWLT